MGAHFFVRVNKSSTSFSPNTLSMARENVFPLALLLLSLIFPLDNTKENRSIPHSLYHQRENILPPYSFWYFLAM